MVGHIPPPLPRARVPHPPTGPCAAGRHLRIILLPEGWAALLRRDLGGLDLPTTLRSLSLAGAVPRSTLPISSSAAAVLRADAAQRGKTAFFRGAAARAVARFRPDPVATSGAGIGIDIEDVKLFAKAASDEDVNAAVDHFCARDRELQREQEGRERLEVCMRTSIRTRLSARQRTYYILQKAAVFEAFPANDDTEDAEPIRFLETNYIVRIRQKKQRTDGVMWVCDHAWIDACSNRSLNVHSDRLSCMLSCVLVRGLGRSVLSRRNGFCWPCLTRAGSFWARCGPLVAGF